MAATAVVAAAACAPVVWPLLVAAGAGASVAAVGAALSQVGGVGSGLLSEAVIRAWDQLRSRGRSQAPQAVLRDELAAQLEESLTRDTSAAAALRYEVAGVLRSVDAVPVVVKESAADVREVLVQGLRELGEQFAEFGWMPDVISQQLTALNENVNETVANTRILLDLEQQTQVGVQILLLQQQQSAAARQIRIPPDAASFTGPSEDEEKAAALDAAEVPISATCPYPGLAAFQPADADRFFGREQLTALLVARAGEQLVRPGPLIVLGPSGSGKSSLLRAGFLHAVIGGALPARGSSAWPKVLITPGNNPLATLANRIAHLAGIPAGALEADLRADPARIRSDILQALFANARSQANARGLPPAADPMLTDLDAVGQQAARARLVLIVDQFEEIFTSCRDEQERRTFIKALCAAAGVATSGTAVDGAFLRQADARTAPALVVIGMRADYYDRATAYPELVPYLQDRQLVVGPLDETGLRQAIQQPAAMAGLVADGALVERLIADLGLRGHPDTRPASTSDDGGREAITARDSYKAGKLPLLSYALQQTWFKQEGRHLSVAGYLATGGINGAVAQAAGKVYTEVGEELGTAGQDAMQLVLLRLVALGEEGNPDSRRRVTLNELTDSSDSNRATLTSPVLGKLIDARLVTVDEDTAEITHDTLLTEWPQLLKWLSDDREGLRTHRELTDAARDWARKDHDPGRLFRGIRLERTLDWASRHHQDLNGNERAFLAASQRDQLRRRSLLTGAVAVVVAGALIAAGIFYFLQQSAVSQSHLAQSEEMAAGAMNLLSANVPLAMLLSVQADERARTPQARSALLEAAGQPLGDVLAEGGIVDSVAFSPNGQLLAVGDISGHVGLWDTVSGKRTATLPEGSAVNSVAFSRNGQLLAAGDAGGHVGLWNTVSGRRTTSLADGSPVVSVAFSWNGQLLAAGDAGGHVGLWDTVSGKRTATLPEGSVVNSVAFSWNGQLLAAGDAGGHVGLWDTVSGKRTATLPEGSAVNSVAFSRNGQLLAAGDAGGHVGLWDTVSGRRTTSLADGSPVNSVAFSRNGQLLAAGDAGGDVGLWDTVSGRRTTSLADGGHVNSVAFSPDGHTLAAGDDDGDVGLWETGSGQRTAALAEGSPVSSVAFGEDGRTLAVGGLGGQVGLWDTGSGTRTATLTEGSVINSVAFSPDEHMLAVGDGSGHVGLWNTVSGKRTATLFEGSPVFSLAFSPSLSDLHETTGTYEISVVKQGETGPLRL